MKVYFLRHGQSLANVQGVFADPKSDSPLSDLGMEQAKAAGSLLIGKGIARIISSPRKRALQTAHEVAKVIGFEEKNIELDDRIVDYDAGELNGTPYHPITPEEMTTIKEAEDIVDFQNRVLSFLREVKDESENILLVSHSVVGLAFESKRQGIDPHNLFSLSPYPNAEPVELELDWLE